MKITTARLKSILLSLIGKKMKNSRVLINSISDNVLLANRFGNQGVINIANNFTCGRNYILGEIPVYAAPYLYPFVVEYSLIASAVIFAMWRSIGSNPRYVYKNHITYRYIDPSHHNFENCFLP